MKINFGKYRGKEITSIINDTNYNEWVYFLYETTTIKNPKHNQKVNWVTVPVHEKEGIFDKKNSSSKGYYTRPHNVESTGDMWPSYFDLIYFAIENRSENIIQGKWIFKDFIDDNCKIEMSDGNVYLCNMGEFAEFTLTKVE